MKNNSRIFISCLLLLCLMNLSRGCCDDDTITVIGQGQVSVSADIGTITITASNTAKTASDAQKVVAAQLVSIRNKLTTAGIQLSDIQTQSISISPQYEYSNGVQTFTGYTAQQTLTVINRKITTDNGVSLGLLIDNLSNIQGITINSLNFDKADKTKDYSDARKIAFANAKAKATQDAKLAERGLGNASTIIDSQSSSFGSIYMDSMAFAKFAPTTTVNPGIIIVTYSISIKYALTNI